MPDFGAVILAAGASTRLGQPKQLLRFGEETLVAHAAKLALASCSNVAVVVGAFAGEVRRSVDALPVAVVENPDWQRGIGSSIKTGVAALASCRDIAAILVMTCDQPLITFESIGRLLTAREETLKPLIASTYCGVAGIPALFDRTYIPYLLALSDARGAKHLIQRRPEDVAEVNMPEAAFDIDTESDLATLSSPLIN